LQNRTEIRYRNSFSNAFQELARLRHWRAWERVHRPTLEGISVLG
jgi:hypothetical protein